MPIEPNRSYPKSGLLVFLAVILSNLLTPTDAFGQTFSKSFSVTSKNTKLELINQTGSIKIISSGSGSTRITVNAKQQSAETRVNAAQSTDGNVKIDVSGPGKVDFEVTVPQSTNLDLLSYKGSIFVSEVTGEVKARITIEGDITFTGMQSRKVEAHVSNGNVSFSGNLLDGGEYNLKSFSGRIDATFPSNADFKLSASSFSGVVDLGGFPMKFDRQTNQLVEATSGSGRSKVTMWSQEGSIHLHRKQ